MLGTPSLTVKAIVMGERVQNFRCFQPDGSGSNRKLRPNSMTVTTRPPSAFSTSPGSPEKCQLMKPAAATSTTTPIRTHRAREVISVLLICTPSITRPKLGALRLRAKANDVGQRGNGGT